MLLFCKAVACFFIVLLAVEVKAKNQLPPCKDDQIWPFCPKTFQMCFCCEICQTAICSNNGNNLTVVPSLPTYVKHLKFERNNLSSVTKRTFKNLRNLKLNFLSLASNNIGWISKDAFSQLRYIKTLDLSNNFPIHKYMDEALTAIAQTEVEKIYLNNISFNVIHDTDLQFLNTSKVSTICLTKNDLHKFNGNAFSKLPGLERINMSDNAISVFKLKFALQRLIDLDLSTNKLKLNNKTPFCNTHKGNILGSNVPNVIFLDLSNNNIDTITQDTFKCLEILSCLNLSKNPIVTLSNYIFKPLRSLDKLSLKNLYKLAKIEDSVFGFSNFKSLSFSTPGTSFVEYVKRNKNIFRHCRNLTTLDLSGTPIPRSYLYQNKLFLPLKNLKSLYLRDVKLRTMPVYIFSRLLFLEKLYIDKNKIKSWRGSEVFGTITSLKSLYLDDNKISIVSEKYFTTQLLKSLKYLSLSNNPLQCTCENKWLRDYVRNHNGKDVKILSFNYYKCPDFSLFKNYNPTEDDCKVTDYVSISIGTVSAILVMFLLTSSIAYKMRWRVRYQLYLIRSYKKGYEKIPNNVNSQYGAYVIYSSADTDRIWVHQQLIPRLEKKHNIKLCIRMRDFTAGGVIMDAMVESLKQSNKVILVLSDDFAKCDWCKFQLTLVHDRLMAEGRSILLVVNFRTISVDNMNDYLHWLMTNNTHFDWSKEEVAKKLFWEQLVTALKLPNENHGIDSQDEKLIPNPMTQTPSGRLCNIL